MSGKNNTQRSHVLNCTLVDLTSKLTSGCNQPCVGCVSWTLSPDINSTECEADHSLQSSAQFKKPPWNAHTGNIFLFTFTLCHKMPVLLSIMTAHHINFSTSILLNALDIVLCIVNKLWAWWFTVWVPAWVRDSTLLKTRSVAHIASYSMAVASDWIFKIML